jgi:spore germination protein GerM
MKTKRKSKKKSGAGKIILVLILVAAGLFALVHFREEILKALKPKAEKKVVAKEKKEITLFFSDEEGGYLIGEKRQILKKGDVEREARETVAELARGPKGKLIPTLPSQTKLLAFDLDEKGLAKVSFNAALSKDHPGGSSAEVMTVYSIVNSLTLNFPQIKRVQILIEGKEVETIRGHLSLKRPIPPNPSLVKGPVKGPARKETKQESKQ